VFFHERDGDIEGQARERDARLRGKIPLSLARARLGAARRLSDHHGGRRAHRALRRACLARVVVRAESEIWDSKTWSSLFVFVEVTFRAIFFQLGCVVVVG
jgi:hypothetical protein